MTTPTSRPLLHRRGSADGAAANTQQAVVVVDSGLLSRRRGRGAPVGSTNRHDGRIWRQAILNALRKRSRSDRMEALEQIADKLLRLCQLGSVPALRELGDRIDGKAPQAIIGDPDNPLFVKAVREMTDEELERLARGVGERGG